MATITESRLKSSDQPITPPLDGRKNERNLSFDIIRIIAVLAVVMIHASAEFVISYDTSSPEFFWGNIFNGISRIGVPFFLMVSGALLLDENHNFSMKKLFLKNIKNIVLLLIFWAVFYSFVYQVALPILYGDTVSFKLFAYSALMGHFHMWYLYMIVGLYLITPFLRAFVKKENKHLILLFVILSVLTQLSKPILVGLSVFWDDAKHLVTFIDKFYLDFFGGYVTYYVVGWYIAHVGIKKKWCIYCIGAVSLLAAIAFVFVTKDYSNGYSEQSALVLFYSAAVFTVLNREGKWKLSERTQNIIRKLSALSFGVYIVHPLFQTLISKFFEYSKAPLVYILLYFGMLAVFSFVSCFVLSRIPFLKKLIRA